MVLFVLITISEQIKNIFAIGDIIDRVQLTLAIYEAMCLIDNFVQKKKKANYKNIPTAVFSNPNFSSVGLSEEQAKRSFKSIEVYTSGIQITEIKFING